MYDFATATDTWFSTWPQDITQRAMTVYVPPPPLRVHTHLTSLCSPSDYVKMWKQC